MQSKQLTDGLAALARSNQQTRDTALLRATTELFVRELTHDRDEIRRYEELATHFLPKISIGDRAYVAERLAGCADAPQSVIRMLARDVIDVAAPVIGCSPVLDPLDLMAVIAATGVEHHRLIARRSALPDQVRRALRLTGDADVLEYLDNETAMTSATTDTGGAANTERSPASITPLRQSATNPLRDDRDPARFLGLERTMRLRLLADFATRAPARRYTGSANRLDRAFRSILGAAKIVGYARSGQPGAIIAAIADGLELDPDFVSACVSDATGEALAVLLKALRLDDAQAQQVFLLATPSGRDTTTFFPLADLYAGMEPSVAETICEMWRTAAEGRRTRHQPYLADDGERRRSAAGEAPGQGAAQVTEQSKRA